MGRGKTISQALFYEARDFFKARYPNNETRRAYTQNYRKFVNYCRTVHDCRTNEECYNHIGDYSKYLQSRKYTPSTIHSYLSAVTIFFGVSLSEFDKPKRHTADYTRGRVYNGREERCDNDTDNPKYERTVEFEKRVGIRRNELRNLCGDDFCYDESGNFCVVVRKGKGGKRQMQRVIDYDVDFVKTYFDSKSPDERIFIKDELTNKIGYHYLRAKFAQKSYEYYSDIAKTSEGRAMLEEQIRLRWENTNISKQTGKPKKLRDNLIKGTYYLRGKNKAFATLHGLPIKYDKLSLMATSVFSLAHFRNDVTCESYMLVI